MQNFLAAFENKSVSTTQVAVRINNVKYMRVNYIDGDADSDENPCDILNLATKGGGATIAKTKMGYVFASFCEKEKVIMADGSNPNQNKGLCCKTVENCAKFLFASGF